MTEHDDTTDPLIEAFLEGRWADGFAVVVADVRELLDSTNAVQEKCKVLTELRLWLTLWERTMRQADPGESSPPRPQLPRGELPDWAKGRPRPDDDPEGGEVT